MSSSEKPHGLTKSEKGQLALGVIASLTLGLAPFFPEPHLVGKWRWLLGGAKGMQAMDWFDLVLHSAPWAFLVFVVVKIILVRVGPEKVS
jgi:hypothetical protein